MGKLLNISIVLYKTPEDEWKPPVQELLRSKSVHKVYLVDNCQKSDVRNQISDLRGVEYIQNEKNIGYGAAHNKAIRETIYDEVPYHLVINSDIEVSAKAIDNLVGVMEQNPLVGQLMPRVVGLDGEEQYLCKQLPTPWDLLRRILLGKRSMNSEANRRFELRDIDHSRPINAPYLSGCFMLLRTETLQKVGLFDERYFMYPEDIDLTRRIHREYLTLYYPSETIVHAHRRASYHSLKMLWVHATNMARYYSKWGWLCDSERMAFNKQLRDAKP